MPILKIDSMGRIYQTSRDSENGTGYSSHAVPVSSGDNTLGSAITKANQAIQNSALRNKKLRELEDQQNRLISARAEAKRRALAQSQSKQAALYDNPAYVENLTRKALVSNGLGCGCPLKSTSLSGHGLSANGRLGYHGMTRDQQAIHQHLSGNHLDASYSIDRQEIEHRRQHLNNLGSATSRIQAEERINRLKSRR